MLGLNMNNNVGVKVNVEDLHKCFVEFKKYLKESDSKITAKLEEVKNKQTSTGE